MSSTPTMRAIQLLAPGPPSALKLVTLPIPTPQPGEVLIRVKAFGLNRSDLLVRRFGRAPVGPVQLPRVLGVEAVGLVESAPGRETQFPRGAVAMTAVGGMGIVRDGGYAEFACVDAQNVLLLRDGDAAVEALGWAALGALPEMLQTAHGSLFRSLRLEKGEVLLVRGGTTSVGLAAAAIAKVVGATVVVTTRREDQETVAALRENGADHVIAGAGDSIQAQVKALFPEGVNKVLELVGGSTIADSMACLATGGICCFTGLVGGSPNVQDFSPLAMIQIGRYLTAYGERNFNAGNLPLDSLVGQMVEGKLRIKLGKTFQMTRIVEAHELMEKNESIGKVVVLTGM